MEIPSRGSRQRQVGEVDSRQTPAFGNWAPFCFKVPLEPRGLGVERPGWNVRVAGRESQVEPLALCLVERSDRCGAGSSFGHLSETAPLSCGSCHSGWQPLTCTGTIESSRVGSGRIEKDGGEGNLWDGYVAVAAVHKSVKGREGDRRSGTRGYYQGGQADQVF
jgi:hypothetical protein